MADLMCGDEVCWGKSGYCDCNGNHVWEGNETGITCGMNKPPKSIHCNKECMLYNCTYQFFNTSNCTEDGAGEMMYGKSRYWDLDSEFYKSVLINHPGCEVTIYTLDYMQGEHSTIAVGKNETGPVCKNFEKSFIDQVESAESIDDCHMGHHIHLHKKVSHKKAG